jgi:hypothetical protein
MLRREAVEKMRDQGLLTRSPYRFFPNLEEDVIITPLMYSTGYTACDDVDEGGMFAICGKEPWIHPFELCKRGHYIVHPVKYGVTKLEPKLSEAELAEWLLNYSPESDLSRSPASPSD